LAPAIVAFLFDVGFGHRTLVAPWGTDVADRPTVLRAGSTIGRLIGFRQSERYSRNVADDEKVWTAAELEELAPDERQELLNERVATDLSVVSPEFVARARSKGRALLEAREVLGPTQP